MDEPWLLKYVPQRLSTAFDVGANHGQWTMVFIGRGAEVWSFEPNPRLASLLRQTFPAGAHVVESAVGRSYALRQLQFFQDDRHSTLLTDYPQLDTSDRGNPVFKQLVFTLPLDETRVVPEFVKIDVEGGEVEVLEGAQQLLNGQQTRWLIEVHSEALGERVKALLEGYEVTHIPHPHGPFPGHYWVYATPTRYQIAV